MQESPILEWDRTYGGADDDFAHSLVETSDRGYAIGGITWSFGAGGKDVWLFRSDADGNIQWSKTYGGANDDDTNSVVQTHDGGYALAGGTTSFGNGGNDCYLVKTDSDGNMEWNKAYGGTCFETACSVIQTSDGGYALAGATSSFGNGRYDFWLIKLAPKVIQATAGIDPNTLNLRSKGKWITAYIEFPEGYDVHDINVSSILLNDTIPVDPSVPTAIGDYDNNGIPDLMIKFDRAEVISYILDNIDIEERFATVTLTITGYLYDGTPFQGSNTIKIIYSDRYERLVAYMLRYEKYMQRF